MTDRETSGAARPGGPPGRRAAGRAGLETIAVLTGGFSEAELREAGAACVFHSLSDLRAVLDETPLRGAA